MPKYSFVKKECLVMCKLCTPDPDAEADECAPVLAPGAYSTASTMLVMFQKAMMICVMVIISLSISNNAAL